MCPVSHDIIYGQANHLRANGHCLSPDIAPGCEQDQAKPHARRLRIPAVGRYATFRRDRYVIVRYDVLIWINNPPEKCRERKYSAASARRRRGGCR